MKLLSILLFTFELLAPTFLFGDSGKGEGHLNKNLAFNTAAHRSTNYPSLLLFEESGSEGKRESKHDKSSVCFSDVTFVEIFFELRKNEPEQITWVLRKERFDTQPPLFTLNCVLTI